jgi:hypothetical protein
MSENLDSILLYGEIEVKGRLVDASNATLFVTLTHSGESLQAIYKPISGERPLWDFESGDLASRERAAYLISELGDFNLVPLTILRDGPFGMGAVQRWIDVDEAIDLAEFFRTDVAALRATALFDAVINNTDRKIGHLLPDLNGKLFVCDHGVTFHHEDKLRTVLWQWAGEPLTVEEVAQLTTLRGLILDNTEIYELINREETSALIERIDRLISSGTFPLPNPEWPAVPWPPF